MKSIKFNPQKLFDVLDCIDNINDKSNGKQIDLIVPLTANSRWIAIFFDKLRYTKYELEGVSDINNGEDTLISLKKKM